MPDESHKHMMLCRRGYILNKKKLKEGDIQTIRKELTVTPRVNLDYNPDPESFELYIENEDSICVPRYYGVERYGPFKKSSISNPKKVNINFKGSLRENQIPIVDTCMKAIKEQGGGLISIPCGFGKTTISLYLATQLKLKTLVVVHKSFLLNQWYERIEQFTDARIGLIRQKSIDTKDKDIVIAMLQSVSLIDYDKSVFSDFGCVIYDEAHHIAAKVFSKSLQKVGSLYTIGLSATPNRSDGLTKVINWYLGPVMYKLVRKGDNKVLVKIFNYTSDHVLFKEKKRWVKKRLRPNTQGMITNMHKINERNRFIIDILNIIKKDRKTLVLSARRDHLTKLKNIMDKGLKDEKNNYVKTAYYVGGMKEHELKLSEGANIIFATFEMAKEGLDIPSLNTLIIATPQANIEQAIGRILRKPIKNGDIPPLVIDIIDELSKFSDWGDNRRKFYEKNRYTIDFYQVFNDKLISIKDYLEMKGLINKGDKVNVNEEYAKYILGEDVYDMRMDLLDDGEMIEENYEYKLSLKDILNVDYEKLGFEYVKEETVFDLAERKRLENKN